MQIRRLEATSRRRAPGARLEQIADEIVEATTRFEGLVDEAPLVFVQRPVSLVLQQPTEAGDHRDRRPQLVAHEMDELRALTSLQFELLLECRDPVTGIFEAGVFRGARHAGVRSVDASGRRDRGAVVDSARSAKAGSCVR